MIDVIDKKDLEVINSNIVAICERLLKSMSEATNKFDANNAQEIARFSLESEINRSKRLNCGKVPELILVTLSKYTPTVV